MCVRVDPGAGRAAGEGVAAFGVPAAGGFGADTAGGAVGALPLEQSGWGVPREDA